VHDHVIEQWLRAVPDGYVYRVIHVQTGAVAALHEYLPAAWAFRDAEGVMAKPGRGREFQVGLRRFLLRARQLRELTHPSLPRLIEAWPSHGTACILTSPAASKTLSDVVIANGGRLPLDQAWPWLCACCDLAEWLHQQGKIHGSWDPEIIGVTEDNRLVLPMPEVDGPAHPASPWMPLEQTALAPKGVQRGPWTDVFGISGLAAFMLTGQSPATARRQPTAPVINTTARASRTSASAETLPRAMMAAIRVSLLPNARQRPQDIAQLKAMMGLFSTAPVLSEELKAALAAPVVPQVPRKQPGMAPETLSLRPADALAPPASRTRELLQTQPTGLPGSSAFGELPTEPMPLTPSGEARVLAPAASRPGDAIAEPADLQQAYPAYRDVPAWDGDEPLPPDSGVRRRLTAGAAAAGAALVAVAAIWVVVTDKPTTDRAAATTESAQSRDMDGMLKSAPPAAGRTAQDTSPVVTSTPGSSQAAQATGPSAVPAPSAQLQAPAPLPAPSLPPAPEVAVAPAQQPSAGPAAKAAAPEPPRSQAMDKPSGTARSAGKPAAATTQAPTTEPRSASTAPRGPSCSQILLEQSLGAKVSPEDLRNCR
jgi:hypothetical protein